MSEIKALDNEIDRLEVEKKALIGALVRYKKREKLIEKLLNKAQTRNDQLETILEEYLEHSECGLLCYGCLGIPLPGKTKCSECGVQQLEIRARKLLRKAAEKEALKNDQ